MSPAHDLTQKLAELVHRLPPMPDHIDRLLAATKIPAEKEAQIVALIKNDPGLCVELLHLSNSSCYEFAQAVETIDDAVRLVGVDAMVELIGVAYADRFLKNECPSPKPLDDYYAHSREISRACRVLAQVCGLSTHELESYGVVGLIHDMGRLIIMLAASPETVSLMGTACENLQAVIHEENEVWGLNHCDMGKEVCQKWRFSPLCQKGVLRHHTPLMGQDFSYVGALIFLAHFVASSDFTGQILKRMLPAELMERTRLSPAAFDQARSMYQDLNPSY